MNDAKMSMQVFSSSPYNLSTGLCQCILIVYPPLFDKPTTASAELLHGWWHASFIPVALPPCTFHFTKQEPVSYIQTTDWNNTSVFKRTGLKVYTSYNQFAKSY